MVKPLDHLVYAAPNLEAAVADIENRLGLRPLTGGRHPGLGTHNALIGLGPRCYLEIIGPDPEQSAFNGVRPFAIDSLASGSLVTWAAASSDLDSLVANARAQSVDLGAVRPMTRETPEGSLLSWSLTWLPGAQMPRAIPFFIDWGDTPHPASRCSAQARLEEFSIQHPKAHTINEALGLDVQATKAPRAGLSAKISYQGRNLELASH
ncbi:MAG: VOC family protein [Pseudomonadota bacterium]